MEFSTSKNSFDRALPYLPRTLPQHARELLANFWAFRTTCAECNRRVELGTRREIRRVNGAHLIFHQGCADRGVLRLRAEARSPRALAAARDAKDALAAAKRRRV
jgi:hypothetical protein